MCVTFNKKKKKSINKYSANLMMNLKWLNFAETTLKEDTFKISVYKITN